MAIRVDYYASAVIFELWIVSTTIHPNDVRLIFNSPRLQQRQPMRMPLTRPIGDNDHYVHTHRRRHAKDRWKTQVIAYENRHRYIPAIKTRDPITCRIMI